jgi:kinetochore protein Spc25
MSYADNPLTQLPSVDFNFDDLRKRMADFTVKFDAFIEQGRKRVLEERNDFRARLGELSGEWHHRVGEKEWHDLLTTRV